MGEAVGAPISSHSPARAIPGELLVISVGRRFPAGGRSDPRSQTGASAGRGTLRRRPRRRSRPPWRCSNPLCELELREAVERNLSRRLGILVLGFTVIPASSTVSSTAVKRSPSVVRTLTIDPIGRRAAYCRQTSASCDTWIRSRRHGVPLCPPAIEARRASPAAGRHEGLVRAPRSCCRSSPPSRRAHMFVSSSSCAAPV